MTATPTEKIGSKSSYNEISPKKPRVGIVIAIIVVIIAAVIFIVGEFFTNWFGLDEPAKPSAPESVSVLMQTMPEMVDAVRDGAQCRGATSVTIPGEAGGSYAFGDTVITSAWTNDGVTVTLEGGKTVVSGFLVDAKTGTVDGINQEARRFTLNRHDFGGSVPQLETMVCILGK